MKRTTIMTAGVIAVALAMAGAGQAHAHNLLLVAGSAQISIIKLTNGNVIIKKTLAEDDAGKLDSISPAAGGHR